MGDDRSIQQVAAARRFVDVLAQVGEAVRNTAPNIPRDELRSAFRELAAAGLYDGADTSEAVQRSIALLAAQLAPADDATDRLGAELRALRRQLEERDATIAEMRADFFTRSGAQAAPPPPAQQSDAALVMERVNALAALGRRYKVTIEEPRVGVVDLARKVRAAAPACGVASATSLATVIALGAGELVIVEPNREPTAEERRSAALAAGFALADIEQAERGGARHG